MIKYMVIINSYYKLTYIGVFQIGFNGGTPITEEFFIATVAGKHNNDIALALFPGDLERGLKFLDDKEAMFRR